ncbi:MAG: Ppx/GppA phosphatase family protein [Candidatus Nanopelagicaceae bacterium]
MRLGVLDIGSNTIHLQVMDAHLGARPSPTTNFKVELKLSENLEDDGNVSASGIAQLHAVLEDALEHARQFNTDEILAFATSAIREAKNGSEIIAEINSRYELDLQILSGEDEARLTFLAVRRWLGWSAGKLLILDIGGGSLEIALGNDKSPDFAISLPLGAGRLTRDFLTGDPFTNRSISNLEEYVSGTLKTHLSNDLLTHEADHFVATSKTFRTLARQANYWYGDSPKVLEANALLGAIPRLADMTKTQRAALPGVSSGRANQIVAGGIVARSIMEILNISELEICPWALREGVILKWLDWLER